MIFLSVGCDQSSENDDNPTPPTEEPWYSIFDTAAWEVLAEPNSYIPGDTTTVVVRCMGHYDGVGRISLSGAGGGRAVGRLLEPVVAELGYQVFATEFVAGVPLEWRFPVEMTSTLSLPRIDVSVAYDSVVVAGLRRDIHSAEAVRMLGGGAITGMIGQVVLTNSEATN